MKKKTSIELDRDDIIQLIIDSVSNKGYEIKKDQINFKLAQGGGIFNAGEHYLSGASITIFEDI